MHCDHTLQVSEDLSSWLHSTMSWHPDIKACPSTFGRLLLVASGREMAYGYMLGVISQERLKIKVNLLMSANRKSYTASISTKTDELE